MESISRFFLFTSLHIDSNLECHYFVCWIDMMETLGFVSLASQEKAPQPLYHIIFAIVVAIHGPHLKLDTEMSGIFLKYFYWHIMKSLLPYLISFAHWISDIISWIC